MFIIIVVTIRVLLVINSIRIIIGIIEFITTI